MVYQFKPVYQETEPHYPVWSGLVINLLPKPAKLDCNQTWPNCGNTSESDAHSKKQCD